jgi:hypothetical protein
MVSFNKYMTVHGMEHIKLHNHWQTFVSTRLQLVALASDNEMPLVMGVSAVAAEEC